MLRHMITGTLSRRASTGDFMCLTKDWDTGGTNYLWIPPEQVLGAIPDKGVKGTVEFMDGLSYLCVPGRKPIS